MVKTMDNLIEELVEKNDKVNPILISQVFVKWLGMLLLYSVLVLLIKGLPEDSNQKSQDILFISEMVLSVISFIFAGFLALNLAIPNINRSKVLNYSSIIPFVIMGYLIMSSSSFEVKNLSLEESLKNNHFLITITLILYSLPAIFLTTFMVKKLNPTELSWNGFMILLSATSLGHFLIRMTEKADNIAAILVWCYFPIIILSMFGIIIGKRFLKW